MARALLGPSAAQGQKQVGVALPSTGTHRGISAVSLQCRFGTCNRPASAAAVIRVWASALRPSLRSAQRPAPFIRSQVTSTAEQQSWSDLAGQHPATGPPCRIDGSDAHSSRTAAQGRQQLRRSQQRHWHCRRRRQRRLMAAALSGGRSRGADSKCGSSVCNSRHWRGAALLGRSGSSSFCDAHTSGSSSGSPRGWWPAIQHAARGGAPSWPRPQPGRQLPVTRPGVCAARSAGAG